MRVVQSFSPQFAVGKPFKPFEQLMGVLPPASKHALPRSLAELMHDESVIGDFYPSDFKLGTALCRVCMDTSTAMGMSMVALHSLVVALLLVFL